ncbi:MAG: hypothetical protein CR991_01020 [Proteobacteria bacterium]|nr:MAG: hypothetical protein CR991_01020 [Pseudomonadota bacterium]
MSRRGESSSPLSVLLSDYLPLAYFADFLMPRKSKLIHLAAQLKSIPLWLLLFYIIQQTVGLSGLFVPAILCLYLSLEHYRRYRLIVDTPTTHLSTGAQGYVELHGMARLLENETFRGRFNLPPTVWMPGVCTTEPFILDDGYGTCLLYPNKAEVFASNSDTHHNVVAIFAGQMLYVLGELRTSSGVNAQTDLHLRTSQILSQWKQQPHILLEGYDKDSNGKLDPEEWEAVRQQALEQAKTDIQEDQLQTATHVIDQPTGNRLFMITNIPPDRLQLRYQIASNIYLLLWLILMAIAWTAR